MESRLQEKLEAQQYYDYEQLVKTLFFKSVAISDRLMRFD